jgi:hypothetical protein
MSIPGPFIGLVDDAAVFPPGSMSLQDAVPAHAAHLVSDHRALVGRLVVTGADLADTASLVDLDTYPHGLAVTVVVPSPSAIAATLGVGAVDNRLQLAGLEVKLDQAGSAVDQVAGIDASRAGRTTYVEMPRPDHPEWPAALQAAVVHGLRLKFRTGGTERSAFPSEHEVAAWIYDAVHAGAAFKCTAGLHHAVRHTGADTGFEHHGYLNILLATIRARGGADPEALIATLAERDGEQLADALRKTRADDLTDARRTFQSYGSCSIDEPLADLSALGLLDDRAWEKV